MVSQYNGFSSKRLESAYQTMVEKSMSMLVEKIFFLSNAGDFLPDKVRSDLVDEPTWAKKLLRLFKTMKHFEKRKHNGGHFSARFRQLASYYAVKHKLYLTTNVIDDGDAQSEKAGKTASKLDSILDENENYQNDAELDSSGKK